MPGCELARGDVARGVPVLSEENVIEAGGEGVDAEDDVCAPGDGEWTTGHEVDLHVDDEQGVGGSEVLGMEARWHGCAGSSLVADARPARGVRSC